LLAHLCSILVLVNILGSIKLTLASVYPIKKLASAQTLFKFVANRLVLHYLVVYGTLLTNMVALKKLRLKKLLSQDKLAKLSGVSRTTIVAIENGQHKPQPLTLQKLANALGVDPSEIEDNDISR